jgi:succinate-acetate transporter protein
MATDQSETPEKEENATDAKPAPGAGIADPGPLGLAAFAATTFVLSTVNAGLIGEKLEPVVLGLALAYGGLAQLLAGMWEFKKNNTFGATAFTSYGAFWLAFALYAWQFAPKLPSDQKSTAAAVFLLAFTIFTFYMMIASLRTTGALVAVFVLLFLTFLALTGGDFTGKEGVTHLGGYLGILTAIAAWYASFAGVVNSTFKKSVVPVFPLGAR